MKPYPQKTLEERYKDARDAMQWALDRKPEEVRYPYIKIKLIKGDNRDLSDNSLLVEILRAMISSRIPYDRIEEFLTIIDDGEICEGEKCPVALGIINKINNVAKVLKVKNASLMSVGNEYARFTYGNFKIVDVYFPTIAKDFILAFDNSSIDNRPDPIKFELNFSKSNCTYY